MAVTSIYMGSLRYSMNGKKRKNHCANPTRRKTPRVTAQRKPSQSELDRIQASKEHREKYPGERKLVGIATMHKSNAVPIFESDKDHAKDIARMRR